MNRGAGLIGRGHHIALGDQTAGQPVEIAPAAAKAEREDNERMPSHLGLRTHFGSNAVKDAILANDAWRAAAPGGIPEADMQGPRGVGTCLEVAKANVSCSGEAGRTD